MSGANSSPALGSRQATLPPEPEPESGLKRRYRLRRTAGNILGRGHRTSLCGRRSVAADGSVTVWRGDTGAASFRSVVTCGSLWACPVCAARIAARRSETLTALCEAHGSAGGGLAFLTLTMRHTRRQSLKNLRADLLRAWAKLTSGARWKRLRERYGILGFVRVIEVTFGQANGWHPHIHALLFTERNLEPAALLRLKRRLFVIWAALLRGDRWNRAGRRVERGEGACPTYANGIDLKWADPGSSGTVAAYLAKWGAGMELSGHAVKDGRKGNRTPFQLLQMADEGHKQARMLFRSYARTMHGARHLAVSPALRSRYRVAFEPEEDAAALAPELPGLNGEGHDTGQVGVINREAWQRITDRNIGADLLGEVSAHGWDHAVDWLVKAHGISLHGFTVARFMRSGRRQPHGATDREMTVRLTAHHHRRVMRSGPEQSAAIRAALVKSFGG